MSSRLVAARSKWRFPGFATESRPSTDLKLASAFMPRRADTALSRSPLFSRMPAASLSSTSRLAWLREPEDTIQKYTYQSAVPPEGYEYISKTASICEECAIRTSDAQKQLFRIVERDSQKSKRINAVGYHVPSEIVQSVKLGEEQLESVRPRSYHNWLDELYPKIPSKHRKSIIQRAEKKQKGLSQVSGNYVKRDVEDWISKLTEHDHRLEKEARNAAAKLTKLWQRTSQRRN